MNILFLAHNINIHSRTGDAIHVRELAENLSGLGNKVSLVVGLNPSHQNISDFTNKTNLGITYVKEPMIKFPRSHDLYIISKCLSLAKKNPFDIIYERNFSCRIGVILSKLLKIPLVIEINGIVETEMHLQGRHISSIRKRIGKKLRQLFFEQTSKIVVVSPRIKENLVNSYNIAIENIIIVPNGANTTLFRPMDQQNTKSAIGLKQEKKYVCFIGNLAPWQGVEYLIQAAPFIIKLIPEVIFLIVGDGTVRKELENRVKEMKVSAYFLFTGSVIYDLVPYYINASDVCISIKKPVLPGSPLKVFEYMACGKPVIATRKSAYGFEILEEFGAGLLVDQDNLEEISNAITYLLKNPTESKKMGFAGRKLVIDNYSWRNTALKVEQICSSALMK